MQNSGGGRRSKTQNKPSRLKHGSQRSGLGLAMDQPQSGRPSSGLGLAYGPTPKRVSL